MFSCKKVTLKLCLKRIGRAEAGELDDILSKIQKRYSEVFPDWETVFMSLPKLDEEARTVELDRMMGFLKKYH